MLPGILIVIKIMENVVNLYNVDGFDFQVFVDGLISEITFIGKTHKKEEVTPNVVCISLLKCLTIFLSTNLYYAYCLECCKNFLTLKHMLSIFLKLS